MMTREVLEPGGGFEPPASRLRIGCSALELPRLDKFMSDGALAAFGFRPRIPREGMARLATRRASLTEQAAHSPARRPHHNGFDFRSCAESQCETMKGDHIG